MFSQGKYVAKNETVLLEYLSQILKNKLEHLPWLLLGNKIKQQHVISLEKNVFLYYLLCVVNRGHPYKS